MTITLGIILATAAISLWALRDQRVFMSLLFEPYTIHARKDWSRFLTHGFVHGSFLHLAINMYVLYLFGNAVEEAFAAITGGNGATAYLVLYVGGIVLSSLPGYFKHRFDPNYRAVGASGATSAVLFSFILLRPDTELMLILLPIPMPAWVFGLLYLGYEWYMSKRGSDGIAHDAHYFGALYGIAFTALLDPQAVGRFLRVVAPGL